MQWTPEYEYRRRRNDGMKIWKTTQGLGRLLLQIEMDKKDKKRLGLYYIDTLWTTGLGNAFNASHAHLSVTKTKRFRQIIFGHKMKLNGYLIMHFGSILIDLVINSGSQT